MCEIAPRQVAGGEFLRSVEGLAEEQVVPDRGGAHRRHPPDPLAPPRLVPEPVGDMPGGRGGMLGAALLRQRQRLNAQRRREARVERERGVPPAC